MKYSTPEVSQLGSIDDQAQGNWIVAIVPAPMNMILYPGPIVYVIAGY